jgi:hypothetical protein
MRLVMGFFCSAAIVAPRGAQAGYLTEGLGKVVRTMSSFADAYGPASLGQIGRFFEAQILPTAIDAIVPTLPFLRISPSLDFSRITRCKRADVHKCLYYGTTRSIKNAEQPQVLYVNLNGMSDPSDCHSTIRPAPWCTHTSHLYHWPNQDIHMN